MSRLALLVVFLFAGCSAPSVPAPWATSPVKPNSAILTGTHWAEVEDFPTLKRIGYDFAVVDFPRDDPGSWEEGLNHAGRAGLKLIAGLWPPPYTHNKDGSWTIQPPGIAFLKALEAHEQSVLALFVYNEPISSDPNPDGQQYECGFYSGADLRRLRSTIQSVWPSAKVYHDLGDPSSWAPGGDWWQEKRQCIGNKYADLSGVADYVGIWDYPFEIGKGFQKQASLNTLKREMDFVSRSMQPAKVVLDAQSFASRSEHNRWPSPSEMREYNCALRQLSAQFISWYPWRQRGRYDDYLVNHKDYWPLTVAAACSGK